MQRLIGFDTSATVPDIASTFRDTIQNTKVPGRGMLANRMAGGISFSSPQPTDDPFAQFERQPDFEVMARVPLTGGFSADVVLIFLSVFDYGSVRRAAVALDGPTTRRAGTHYSQALLQSFQRLDPELAQFPV